MRLRDTISAAASAVALAAAVLAVGGALRWTEALVATLVAISAIPFVTSRRGLVGWSPLVAVYLIAVALCAIQLIPLPSALREAIAPVGQALRSDGAQLVGVTPWPSLSLDTPGTLHGLAYFVILLGTAVIALRFAVSERGRLSCLAAVAAVCGVTAGIVGLHQVFGASTLYGLYEPVQATPPVLGPLLNANHLGGLMALGAVLSAGLLVYEKQSFVARGLWALTGASCIVVLLATLSRGALLGLLVGLGVTIGALLAQKLAKPSEATNRASRRKFVRTTLPIGVVAVCALIVIIFTSAGTAADQLQNSSLQEINEPKSKFAAWRSAMTLVEESPWIGVGRGALEPAFTRVHPASAFITFSHVENEYVQAVVDWGIPGALLLAGALGWLGVVALRRWRDGPLTAAALGGLATLAVQSNVDFGAELLGLSVPATVVAATLAYVPLRQLHRPQLARSRVGRCALLLALTAAAIVLCLPVTRSVAEDHLALDPHASLDQVRASIERHPLDYYSYAIGAEIMARENDPKAIALLNHALVLHPTHSGLHRFAGRILAASGHADQAAIEYAAAMRGTTEPRDLLSEIARTFPPEQAANAIPLDYDNIGVVMKLLAEEGHAKVGLIWISRVVAQHPKQMLALDLMYSTALGLGDLASAERAARLRFAAIPNPHASLDLARLLTKRGASDDVIKQLSDVTSWHGRIDDQVAAWLLLCDAWFAKGELEETTRCLHRLDAAGLVDIAGRGEILKRLDAIAKKRKEQGLLDHWQAGSGTPSAPHAP